MPQEIKVLKCYKCNLFQSKIANKSNKWICSVCGEKQSLMKCYGTGTGKECRLVVQKLNASQMASIEAASTSVIESFQTDDDTDLSETNVNDIQRSKDGFKFDGNDKAFLESTEGCSSGTGKISKWLKYLDDEDVN